MSPTDYVDKDVQNADWSIRTLLEKKVVPSKVLLGMPFYGHQFSTDKMGQPFAPSALHAGDQIDFAAAAQLAASGDYRKAWDNGGHISYLEKMSGGHTVSYDDEKAIAEKCNYAKEKGLGGVFIWSLGTDVYAGRPVLLDTAAQAMGVSARRSAGRQPQEVLRRPHQRGEEAEPRDRQGTGRAGPPRQGQGAQGLGFRCKRRRPRHHQIRSKSAGSPNRQSREARLHAEEQDGRGRQEARPGSALSRAGKLIQAEGPTLLLADFEDGSITHKLSGNWEAEFDQNKLGTTLSPSPLKLTPGGYKGSKTHADLGHYGRNGAPPWPYADVGASMPNSDLSQFKAIRFAAKGDGKPYLVVFRRAAVRDYGHFRGVFRLRKTGRRSRSSSTT